MVYVVYSAYVLISVSYPSGDCVKSSSDRKSYIKRGCDKDKLYHTHDIHYTYEINRGTELGIACNTLRMILYDGDIIHSLTHQKCVG
jgi:hypothetical protein